MKALVIAPAYNESGKITRVVSKVRAAGFDICVVDDCSKDTTSDEARAAGATLVVRHERNRGVGAGIRTGIETARTHQYDAAVIIAGDDQHEPTEIPRLMEALEQGADFVLGSRYLPNGGAPGIPWNRLLLTHVYARLFTLATGVRCTDPTNGLRAFRLQLIDDLGIDLTPARLDTYELEPYLLYQVVTRGARFTEVPCTVRFHARESTTKMIPVYDWWRILRPLVYLRLGVWK